ncbi:MAG: hypothetical protein FWH03_00335 [Firmicutes bacterium]|nr:hypothetical protein [Bacillota bacterium]
MTIHHDLINTLLAHTCDIQNLIRLIEFSIPDSAGEILELHHISCLYTLKRQIIKLTKKVYKQLNILYSQI